MINTEKLKQLKELLDLGAISQEEFEKQKQELMQPPKTKKNNFGLIITIIIVFVICLSIVLGSGSETEVSTKTAQTNTESTIPAEFADVCPVEVSSSMYDNIIGMPEIKCTFKNNTDKEIAAVKLYFSPKNVYGESINNIFTTNELYTDNPIAPGAADTRMWQLMDTEIKSGDVYIYSIYFSDGTEWGDKDASISDIKKYAYKIYTKY